MSISNIVDRVNKLRSLTQSTNVHEAAAAAAAANKLIDQYRLIEADLETTETLEPIEEDVDYIYETGKVTRWKSALISTLVKHYGLTWWNDCSYATGRQVSRFRLVGRRSDITIAKYMFAWLQAECLRLSEDEARGRGYGRVYVASYCDGFVLGIRDQLEASRKEVWKDASSSALVKLDERQLEANNWLASMRPNLRIKKQYSKRQVDPYALNRGKQAGASVHMGQALDVGASTKLLK